MASITPILGVITPILGVAASLFMFFTVCQAILLAHHRVCLFHSTCAGAIA